MIKIELVLKTSIILSFFFNFRRECISMEIFFMINFLKSFDFSVKHVEANNTVNQLFVFSNLRKISKIKLKIMLHKNTLHLRIVHVCYKVP